MPPAAARALIVGVAFAANLGGLFSVREGQHAFLIDVNWIYGMSAVRGGNAAMRATETTSSA